MDNKNFILAIVLSVSFLFLWSVFIAPRFSPPPPPPTLPGATSSPSPRPVPLTAESQAPSTSEPAAADSILRNAQNEIVIASRGGGVRHWRIKLNGKEVDLVNLPDAPTLPLETFSDRTFSVSVRDYQAIIEGSLAKDLKLTKILTLNSLGFLHDLTFRVDNTLSTPVEVNPLEWGWGPGLGTVASEQKENGPNTRAISLAKLKAHDVKPGDYPEIGRWSGIDNRYFLVAFIPVQAHPVTMNVSGAKEQTQIKLREHITVPPHGQISISYQLYAGPKGYTQLRKYGKGLEEGVDFGVFSALGKLILRALYLLYEWTGNYGWAIVLLAVLLQVLTLPLTIKSFKSMAVMKHLQPQIAALQKTYKNDPKRLQIEMMNLYKKAGTNPLGGCLPMLLQLPIFWALFTTLRNAYELRGVPFIGWIRDLSVADPYHVLPIVTGAGMFLQQRMSGATTDPTQRQMMLISPIMFTVMFFNMPAGVVLYWFTQNLFSMGFQWKFQHYKHEPPLGSGPVHPA